MGIISKSAKLAGKGVRGAGKLAKKGAKKGARSVKKGVKNYNKKRKANRNRSHFED